MDLSAKIVVRVVNHLLKNDEEKRALLASCHPKTFCIDSLSFCLFFAISEKGFLEPLTHSLQPDVTIKIPIKTLTDQSFNFEGMKKGIEVNGNAEFASILSKTISGLTWDYEDDLANIFGDILANHISNFIRNLHEFLQQSRDSLVTNLSEYVTEENILLASKSDIDFYVKDVDDLRDSVERLKKRVELYEKEVKFDID